MTSDDETWYDFVTSRYPSLRRTAFLMCGDWSVAAEHTQAVLARLVWDSRRGGIDDPDAQVYADLMAAYQHRPPRRERIFAAPPGGPDAERSPESGTTPGDPASSESDMDDDGYGSPADDAEPVSDGDPIRTVLLLDALHKLSPRCRAVLVLRHWDGFAVDETADMLGLAESRVDAYETAGLAALDHLLAPVAAR
jgi:DNA-directed RNA polymerase specialized sigma24 family protein